MYRLLTMFLLGLLVASPPILAERPKIGLVLSGGGARGTAHIGVLKVLEEYRKNPRTMLVALHSDTVRDVLNQVKTRYVVHARGDGNQEIRLLLGPEPDKTKADNETEDPHGH